MRERFGVWIGSKQMREMIRDIQEGRAVCRAKQSNRLSVFNVDYAGQKVAVVYDKQRKSLVTALPPDWLDT